MPKTDFDKLLKEIDNLVDKQKITWDMVEGDRTISYIPFSRTEDLDNKVELQLRGDRDSIRLRAFGRAIQKAMDEPKGPKTEVDANNVMKCYGKLTEDQKAKVLQTVVRKTPMIVQHGEESKLGKLRPTDSINIIGHGDPKEAVIFTAGHDPKVESTPKTNPKKLQPRNELEPREILERMQKDLGGDLKKIKLGSCGSGGEFSTAFLKTAAEQEVYVESQVFAYKQDSIMLLSKQDSLDHLRTSGKRFVVSDDLLKERAGPELKDAMLAADKLEAQQKLLKTHLETAPENFKGDWAKTKRDLEFRVKYESEKLSPLQKKLDDKVIPIAGRGKLNRVVKTVREVMEEQGKTVSSKVAVSTGEDLGKFKMHK